jgi:hypothetical protein
LPSQITLSIKIKNQKKMKKIIVVLTAILFAFAVNAQDTKMEAKPQTAPGTAEVKPQPKMRDYVTMKDGKMMVMKDGKMTPMEQDMEMTNGTKVITDGSVMKKDGSRTIMQEGDRVYMNGAMRSAGERKSTEKKAKGQEQK